MEVIIAITIFLLGVVFVVQTVGVTSRFSALYQLRQQMAFYAAGLIEAELENADMNTVNNLTAVHPPFAGLGYQLSSGVVFDVYQDAYQDIKLEKVSVRVYKNPAGPNDPEVAITTYRINKQP